MEITLVQGIWRVFLSVAYCWQCHVTSLGNQKNNDGQYHDCFIGSTPEHVLVRKRYLLRATVTYVGNELRCLLLVFTVRNDVFHVGCEIIVQSNASSHFVAQKDKHGLSTSDSASVLVTNALSKSSMTGDMHARESQIMRSKSSTGPSNCIAVSVSTRSS